MSEMARGVIWDREDLPDGRHKYVIALVLVTDRSLRDVTCSPDQGVAGRSRAALLSDALASLLHVYELRGRFQDANDALTADWQWDEAKKVEVPRG